MKVCILGNNSALPAYGRYPTAQVVTVRAQLFLMDCGEGAQMRMQQFEIKSARIHHIFISHVHGDHFYGLVGFISSLSLHGRTQALHIYCPEEVEQIIRLQLKWDMGFELIFRVIGDEEEAILLDEEFVEVSCFKVYHSVPTHGFLFTEKKRKRILLPEKLQAYEIPEYFYKNLSSGEDYIRRDGTVILNELVTAPGHPSKKYAFCADTRYAPEICAAIKDVDLLYHEATYLNKDQQKATDRFHATAAEAAQIALQCGAKQLLIGHFSSKYKLLDEFLHEARPIFVQTELAIEGMTYEII